LSLSKEIIKEIKDKSDIVSIIGEYVRSLKKTGKNWVGLCPFHNDKSPSFSVSEDYGVYRCFACGESGDVIKFVEKIENLTFMEAASFLAKKAGVNIDPLFERDSGVKKRDEFVAFNARLVKLFQHFLFDKKEGERALGYLKQRGLDEKLIDVFKIGYAPKEFGRLERILKKRGFDEGFLIESGLFSAGDKNFKTLFFDRVIFPIFNYKNECVGFGGRALNDLIKPKYINSPETLLYKKSFNLYGVNFSKEFIKEEKKVFIVEGYVDAISCYKNGVKNVVAPCGTALTKEQVKLLTRYCKEVVLLLDSDEAGLKGAVKALNEFANIEDIQSSVLIIPEAKDPDDYFKKHTLEDFKELEKKKLSGFDFLIYYRMRNCVKEDYVSLTGAIRFFYEYINLWDSEIIRDSFTDKLSSSLKIDKGIILREFNNFKNKGFSKTFLKENAPQNNEARFSKEFTISDDEKLEIDLLLFLSNISDGNSLIKRCSFNKDFLYYDKVKRVFESFFCNKLDEKQNIIDSFDDDYYKKYAEEKIFSEEFKFEENILRNGAIDRIAKITTKFYQRKIEEIKESIRFAELYNDEDFVKELMEDKDVIAKEVIKLKKLQELKT